ncbi:MAG: phosphoglycolate phosphatase-like HAD superfamily hydrolase [Candidatus Omnitrophota bacterium]|jgi:phosphoglycolate phosphatase-like HAD superfamily hydrolase
MSYDKQQLIDLPANKTHLVGIDSDGCVFDSMTAKQRLVFHTVVIEHWGLQAIEKELRETMEFVNLYSQSRGQDRFVCFDLSIDLLQKRPEVLAAKVSLPDTADLKTWLASGGPFGNNGLEAAIAGEKVEALKDSASLKKILGWSLGVDAGVKTLDIIPPFPHAKFFLEHVGEQADPIVVSSTPIAALNHEWEGNHIRPYVKFIAAKEIGTKVEHLTMATTNGKYDRDKVLMIGDAPKDMESAEEVGVHFYPINPGKEDASWQRLHEEIFAKFLEGSYTPELEQELKDQFLASMPAEPDWPQVG